MEIKHQSETDFRNSPHILNLSLFLTNNFLSDTILVNQRTQKEYK
jgi:hypothetical protein